MSSPASSRAWRLELAALAAVLALLNVPLLAGGFDPRFSFLPGAVQAGEWWRVLTHPFVHVSAYHLLLDAAAFFVLYGGLCEHGRATRFALLGASTAGSLLVSLWAAPAVQTQGLCGLSAIAHGLSAVAALDLMAGGNPRLVRGAGLASFALVVGKSLVEAVTGEIALASWHLGSLGTPIAVCHAGGVLGALMVRLAWPAQISRHSRTVLARSGGG